MSEEFDVRLLLKRDDVEAVKEFTVTAHESVETSISDIYQYLTSRRRYVTMGDMKIRPKDIQAIYFNVDTKDDDDA